MVADRGPQFTNRRKTPVIEIDDMKLHSDKTQFPAIRDGYADGQSAVFNDLLLHVRHSILAICLQCSLSQGVRYTSAFWS